MNKVDLFIERCMPEPLRRFGGDSQNNNNTKGIPGLSFGNGVAKPGAFSIYKPD
jgi:hypothetical protein